MTDTKIILKPDPILHQVCEPYQHTPEYHVENIRACTQMFDILSQPRKGIVGVGLAAPQIGISRRFFIMRLSTPGGFLAVKTCFDPKILRRGRDTITLNEMCLSCPGEKQLKARAKIIDVEYINSDGVIITETLRGFEARVFQHEMDHLNGILCIDTPTEGQPCLKEI